VISNPERLGIYLCTAGTFGKIYGLYELLFSNLWSVILYLSMPVSHNAEWEAKISQQSGADSNPPCRYNSVPLLPAI
jgi:hypothetical protein